MLHLMYCLGWEISFTQMRIVKTKRNGNLTEANNISVETGCQGYQCWINDQYALLNRMVSLLSILWTNNRPIVGLCSELKSIRSSEHLPQSGTMWWNTPNTNQIEVILSCFMPGHTVSLIWNVEGIDKNCQAKNFVLIQISLIFLCSSPISKCHHYFSCMIYKPCIFCIYWLSEVGLFVC